MQRTVTGYNREHCNNVPIELDKFGTSLLTPLGEYLMLPAGWTVNEIHVKNAGPSLVGTATKVTVYLGEVGQPDIDVYTVDASVLNSSPNASLVGTDSSPIVNSLKVDKRLMVKTDMGSFGAPSPNGAIVSVLFKIHEFK